jgi:hypothetical protein
VTVTLDFASLPVSTRPIILEFAGGPTTQFIVAATIGDASQFGVLGSVYCPACPTQGFDATQWGTHLVYSPNKLMQGFDATQWGNQQIDYKNRYRGIPGLDMQQWGATTVRRNEIRPAGLNATVWGRTLVGNQLQTISSNPFFSFDAQQWGTADVHSNKMAATLGDQLAFGAPGVSPFYIRPQGFDAFQTHTVPQGWTPPNITWVSLKNRTVMPKFNERPFDAMTFGAPTVTRHPEIAAPPGFDSLVMDVDCCVIMHKTNPMQPSGIAPTLAFGKPTIWNRTEGFPC